MSQQQQQQKPSLVWIDCEMTGLLVTDKLIEIAVIITDDDLNIVAEGPNLIIHQPKEIMDNMNQWCIDHHGSVSSTFYMSIVVFNFILHTHAFSTPTDSHLLTLPFHIQYNSQD